MNGLEGKVALVAGGTRGAGRAISVSLAEEGAFVYVTGRSSRQYGLQGKRKETIEETAEMISDRGGEGKAIRVDHSNQDEVEKLIAQIDREKGKLDFLINDISGGESQIDWESPFWKQDMNKGIAVYNDAVMTHLITARYATNLMLRQNSGLIVEITDGIGYHYRGNIFYSLAKVSTNHLALAYAEELKGTQITSIALTPGFLRSEEMLENFGVSEDNWRDAIPTRPDFAGSESPYYIGRCVVALASDPDVKRFNGHCLSTWTLSKIYDFEDIDGSKPDWDYFHRMYGEGQIDPFTWRY